MKMKKRYRLPGILLAIVGLALVIFGAVANSTVQASTTILERADAGLVMIIAGGVMVVAAIIIGLAIFFS